VVPHSQLLPEALKLAATFTSKSPLALRAAKWSANEVELLFTDFEQAYRAIEQRVSAAHLHSEDHLVAVEAFAEKRAPVFTGR
jgi:enoyl-CoA hydratase/carnithine racemase